MNPNFPKSFKPLDDVQQENLSTQKPKFPTSFKPIDLRTQFEKDQDLIWEDSGNLERDIERGTAQGTSRLLEGAFGTLGNIQSTIKGITGVQIGSQLPTTQDLKSFSEKASLGYTKPKNKFEEEGGELLSDIGSMIVPGANSYSAMRNLGIPIAGWMTKNGLENIGMSEGTSNTAKTALMVGLDLASAYKSKGHGGAKKYAQELWTEAESNIPKGVSLKTGDMVSDLEKLKSTMTKGGDSPAISHAVKKIDELIEVGKNGKIPIDELMAFRKKINNLIESQGGFDFSTHPNVRNQSIYNLNQVKEKVIEKLDQYAKINPEFGVPYQQSNEAYSAYHASNYVTKFLKNKFGEYLKSPVLYGLFGGTAKAIGAGAGAAALPYYGIKLMHRVYKSPVLRELYGNVIKGALENNASMTAKNLSELNKELKKEEAIPKSNK